LFTNLNPKEKIKTYATVAASINKSIVAITDLEILDDEFKHEIRKEVSTVLYRLLKKERDKLAIFKN